MQKYHPESALSSEEKLKKVAAYVGLAMPKTPELTEKAKSKITETQ